MAKICCQIGHSGAKGSTRIGWEGMDASLPAGNWPLMAASDVPWSAGNQTPKAMDKADMVRVRDQFVAAAKMANRAGFDMLELHCAHGYLLSSFITPLTNRRSDAYGGTLDNRMRYPLEVFAAMRTVWPEAKPFSVRISANDWVGEDGKSKWYEVILMDRNHPSVQNDPDLNWVCNPSNRGRAFRGKTSAGKKVKSRCR